MPNYVFIYCLSPPQEHKLLKNKNRVKFSPVSLALMHNRSKINMSGTNESRNVLGSGTNMHFDRTGFCFQQQGKPGILMSLPLKNFSS